MLQIEKEIYTTHTHTTTRCRTGTILKSHLVGSKNRNSEQRVFSHKFVIFTCINNLKTNKTSTMKYFLRIYWIACKFTAHKTH